MPLFIGITWSTLNDPAWIFFALAVVIGGSALAALFLLYPFGRD